LGNCGFTGIRGVEIEMKQSQQEKVNYEAEVEKNQIQKFHNQSLTSRYLRGLPNKFLPLEEEIRIGYLPADHRDRWKLVIHNMKFVVDVALRFFHTHQHVSSNPDFFFDNAHDGAIKASGLYRGEHGFKFTTFAFWHIRREMQRAFMKKNGGFSERATCSQFSIDVDVIKDIIAIDKKLEPLNNFLAKEKREFVLKKIEKLPENQKFVIIGYFFEDKKGKDLAEELGVTVQRVSQIMTKSKKSLYRKLVEFKF
jgi:RNA polymerase sigma factor (sigma-70 family)